MDYGSLRKNCLGCGKPFKVIPSMYEKAKYCSEGCWRTHRNPWIKVHCFVCGKILDRPKQQVRAYKRSICGLGSNCRKKMLEKDIPEIFKDWGRKSAYVLGLLASDGYVRESAGDIVFGSIDQELGLFVKDSLGKRARLRCNLNGAGNNYYRVELASKPLSRYLVSIGVVQKKSKILRMPKFPIEFFWDFCRGYFDGNGTVAKDGSITIYTGSQYFASDLVDCFREQGIKAKWRQGEVGVSSYRVRLGRRESRIVAQEMYSPGYCFALERKRSKIFGRLQL